MPVWAQITVSVLTVAICGGLFAMIIKMQNKKIEILQSSAAMKEGCLERHQVLEKRLAEGKEDFRDIRKDIKAFREEITGMLTVLSRVEATVNGIEKRMNTDASF